MPAGDGIGAGVRAEEVDQVTVIDLEGVRVLVTGGTSGLGRSMAAALGRAGAQVVLTGRDGDRAAAAAGALEGAVTGIALDVRDPISVDEAVSEVVRQLGGIDVLVNNAGVGMLAVNPAFFTEPKPFWTVGVNDFRAVVETNLTGYFLVARAVVPRMLDAGGGRIVNISVNHATMALTGFVPYGPSRAGSESLSRIMAADLEGSGITVNLLLPGGATATGMIPDDLPAERRAALINPDVMGPPIVWLSSAASDGVHDERIVAVEWADWLAGRHA